ncbi:hypothetical protein NM688_g5900 [Phlebia brevispora]|uniref:Uncharacterized protein n=1 Tax=Phlebia brevispora TaxID=194682 RepID=A0ACC1SNF0_9APHY|nr:hypothetical protein NM688_g5900 [Phlebia brevispora]
MTVSPVMPPLDGSINLVPGFVDFQAQNNPEKPWVIYPSRDSPTGTSSISFLELSKAASRIARYVRPGGPTSEREVVAVLVHTDTLLNVVLLIGMMYAGLVPFPMSPRNSPQAVCHMLRSTSCHRMIAQASMSLLIEGVKSEFDAEGYALQVDELPPLPVAFPKFGTDEVNGSLDEEAFPAAELKPGDMVMYMHSSGSTGYPKSIPINDRMTMQWCHGNSLLGCRDRRVRYAAMPLPTFHAMGVLAQLVYPLMSSQPITLFEPQWPGPPIVPNIRNTLEISKLANCNGLMIAPAFVEAWAHDDKAIEYLKTLVVLQFGGGPLATKTGDKLVKAGVRLAIAYGGTEFGGMVQSFPEDGPPDAPVEPGEDWAWMRFSKRSRVRMVPEGDGTYELQVLATDQYVTAIENLPDVRGYATADLFIPHPTRPGLWKIVGRKDDVIVLGTGEKIVPLQQEEHITINPMVMGALMFGREREQAGILIEPHPKYAVDPDDEAALAEFRNKIWPSVEAANRPAPAFARIFKEMILVTKPDKPLPRAGKGTVIRKQAIALYADEIDKLYDTVADSSDSKGIAPPNSWEPAELEAWLTEHAAAVGCGHIPLPTVSLFDQGFDSATFMRNRIVAALRNTDKASAASAVPQNFIFDFPTIRELASATATIADPSSDTPGSKKNRAMEIVEMVQKYTAALPAPRGRQAGPPGDEIVVLLTGSTGNIGSHILASLLEDKRITKIYTLNRPSTTSADRLVTAFKDRCLPVELLSEKKLFSLIGDLTQSNFGLTSDVYEEIKNSVTHIIHNAWTVNFNHPLSTFESQIAGVRKVIDLLATLNRPVRLLFTSSIGATNGWDPRDGPVPERPLDDPQVAAATGYTSSKYVVEQILAKADAKGMNLMSLRMGQACGSKSTGAWGTTEWFPILVKSSVALGCLPRMKGPVAWVPLDAIGQMYIDVLVSPDTLPQVVNVVHPRPTTWTEVLDGIREELGGHLPFVSLDEWVAKLDALPAEVSNDELQRIPALKLRPFFRGLANTDKQRRELGENSEGEGALLHETSQLRKCSKTMQQLPPMDKENARMWVRYWKSRKYL